MDPTHSYTTEEIAKLLRISKLTVYDLIKKGDLPAYRVGKQMRIDAVDFEAYKQHAKDSSQRSSARPNGGIPDAWGGFRPEAGTVRDEAPGPQALVITGQDPCLDILATHLQSLIGGIRTLRSHAGSLDSLIAMYQGKSHIVSTHLLDGDTGTYNIPYIRKILVGFPIIVVHLLSRPAGLYVAKGNPKQLLNWTDLGQSGVTMVNRERGSGARVLLDEQLRIHGLRSTAVEGYRNEVSSHLGVAGRISLGLADVGIGIEKAASIVGIDFIPLIQEDYDLVLMNVPDNQEWIVPLMRLLGSDSFREELRSIGGYDLSRTGTILYQA
ncbi:substrate-binding domain-containing protein [Paenibacillus nasutitermitis]|uniref:Helix-turn-helix domain-containing protein n=1 Tax=Paenibacillus nasutitermitis TaxID=1652958 RepID=A0A917DKX2_9BACL|nr:helix-turn-helix transcriptional regulator [Paenibacillus nasutitermitis]GGD47195.1 hypothetical protein GCM10010911_00880 [Paenibacillus nasutitermitis]